MYTRRVLPTLDKRVTNKTRDGPRIIILTNNFCNLACYSCSTLSDKPWGSNPFRDQPYEIPTHELEAFLANIEGFNPDWWIRFEGGETTMLDPDHVEALVGACKSAGRKVDLLTNGFGLVEGTRFRINPELFDGIILDQHRQNENDVKIVSRLLDMSGYQAYNIHILNEHIDLERMRTGGLSLGRKCREWGESWALWRGVVYPCFVSPVLDGWNNSGYLIRDALIEAGYVYDNPDLTALMMDPDKFIPVEFRLICAATCWRGGKDVVKQFTDYVEGSE